MFFKGRHQIPATSQLLQAWQKVVLLNILQNGQLMRMMLAFVVAYEAGTQIANSKALTDNVTWAIVETHLEAIPMAADGSVTLERRRFALDVLTHPSWNGGSEYRLELQSTFDGDSGADAIGMVRSILRAGGAVVV
ncbi:hypothetical protein AK812_SmicGene28716 [Symbiodinium microadriaticum]|uniref:Uncharacterized protein n=1 Tax=Symbiodinium microadriaticum TaxID=2951 RepID=A0A1Q9D3M7_SYMMI|nr:hypothetical protein AK812_SmicGene28716 [Symbiodinium microadriaticum]